MVNGYLRQRWKNPLVKFGALQVGKVLSNGETYSPGKNCWKGLLESLVNGSRIRKEKVADSKNIRIRVNGA